MLTLRVASGGASQSYAALCLQLGNGPSRTIPVKDDGGNWLSYQDVAVPLGQLSPGTCLLRVTPPQRSLEQTIKIHTMGVCLQAAYR